MNGFKTPRGSINNYPSVAKTIQIIDFLIFYKSAKKALEA